MTADPGGPVTADEAVLAALARRLAAIDDELPRLRPWRTDRVAAGQLHVVRGRTRPIQHGERGRAPAAESPSRRRVRIKIAAAWLAAVVAVAILAGGGRLPEVGRPATIAAASQAGPAFSLLPDGAAGSPSPTPTTTAEPPSTTAPTPTRPETGPRPTPLVPDPGSGPRATDPTAVRAVLVHLGWTCAVHLAVALDPLAPGLIDKLAVTAGAQGGFAGGGASPIWIGSDPLSAARAFKGRPLLTDASGDGWILRPDGSEGVALRLVPERASSGATAWRSADVLRRVACPPPGTDPKRLLADLSPGDWPSGGIVDIAIVRGRPAGTTTRQPQ